MAVFVFFANVIFTDGVTREKKMGILLWCGRNLLAKLFYLCKTTDMQPAFIPNIKKTTLWDIDLRKLDFVQHAEWLIERVFNRGEMNEVFQIMACYGVENVKKVLMNAEILEGPGLNLAAAILNIPKEKFKCYGKKLYRC